MTDGRRGVISLQACYFCVAEVIRTRRRVGAPIPGWMRAHYDQLDTEIRGMSRRRHKIPEIGCGQPQSDEWIGVRETAEILKLSKRQVQRIASDLGGQLISGRWVFNRDTRCARGDNKMGDHLKAALEDYLAGLPQEEWRALVARIREPSEPLPPDTTESRPSP
jgi:hypothetical protein